MLYQNITVVNIDGRAGDLRGGPMAIARGCHELPGSKGLLLSPQRPESLIDGIEHVPIQPLGYFDYGVFVLYALHALVKTDFALIVQEDGWVLSGDCWSNEFFSYDLIGAPVHLARVTPGSESKILRHFHWADFLDQPDTTVDIVLNGGFSLRSRRMLEAPLRLSEAFVLPPPSGLIGPPWGMAWESDLHLEDVQLCLQMRTVLERTGMRYCPLQLACRFAFEHLCPVLHDRLDLGQVFGQHSKLRRLRSIDPSVVAYTQSRASLADSYHDEDRVAALLRRRGFDVVYS